MAGGLADGALMSTAPTGPPGANFGVNAHKGRSPLRRASDITSSSCSASSSSGTSRQKQNSLQSSGRSGGGQELEMEPVRNYGILFAAKLSSSQERARPRAGTQTDPASSASPQRWPPPCLKCRVSGLPSCATNGGGVTPWAESAAFEFLPPPAAARTAPRKARALYYANI